MITHTIPAGLLDNDVEFFNDPTDQEIAYCLTGGQVTHIPEAPEWVLQLIDMDMIKYPDRVEALVKLGYETLMAQREKYVSCCFGAFDGQPDSIDGELKHSEYWNCPQRGTCPVEGILCDGLLVGAGGVALTRREIDVFRLVCDPNKIIADKLGIAEQTVKIHMKHIQEKTGLEDKKALVKLAFQKNLIS